MSERRVCAVLGQHRSTQRKMPTTPDDEAALTATWGGEYVVFDQTVDVNTPAPFDPRFMDIVSSHRRYEKVSVRSDVLARIVELLARQPQAS